MCRRMYRPYTIRNWKLWKKDRQNDISDFLSEHLKKWNFLRNRIFSKFWLELLIKDFEDQQSIKHAMILAWLETMKELLFIQHQTTLFYGIETIGALTVIGIGCDVSSLYNMHKYLPLPLMKFLTRKIIHWKHFYIIFRIRKNQQRHYKMDLRKPTVQLIRRCPYYELAIQ